MRPPLAPLVLVSAILLSSAPGPAAAQYFSTWWGGDGGLITFVDLQSDGVWELLVQRHTSCCMGILDPVGGYPVYELPPQYGPGTDVVTVVDQLDGPGPLEMVVIWRPPTMNTIVGVIEWSGVYGERWRLALPAPGLDYQVSVGRFVSGMQHLLISAAGTFQLYGPSDGAVVYDWSVEHPGILVSSPEVWDLDGDGLQEILVQTQSPDYPYLYLVRSAGGVAVPGEPAFTSRLVLGQNAPNPFARVTEIAFETPRRERAVVRVFDPAGRLVRTLLDRTVEPGRQRVTWDGRDNGGHPVTSGTYFYDVTVAGERQTRKMVQLH